MFNRILVAVDDRAATEWTMKVAGELAQRFSAALGLIHVLKPADSTGLDGLACMPDSVRRNMQPGMALMQKLRRQLPGHPFADEYIVFGNAGKEIVRTARAWKADLIVIGDHNRQSLSGRPLGGTADTVVRCAPCAVLVIPATHRSDEHATELESVDTTLLTAGVSGLDK